MTNQKGNQLYSPPPITDIWTVEKVYQSNPVSSVSTKGINDFNLKQLAEYAAGANPVPSKEGYICRKSDIKRLISHGTTVKNPLAKAALCCVTDVINYGHSLSQWGYKDVIITPLDKMSSHLFGAPILIDGVKYLCKLTLRELYAC